jgi:hypothetical protein
MINHYYFWLAGTRKTEYFICELAIGDVDLFGIISNSSHED